MGNGCAAPAWGRWSIRCGGWKPGVSAFARAKNGGESDQNRDPLLSEAAKRQAIGKHWQMLASEHLRQNGAAE